VCYFAITHADDIILRQGFTFQGKIIHENLHHILLYKNGETQVIDRSVIKEIRYLPLPLKSHPYLKPISLISSLSFLFTAGIFQLNLSLLNQKSASPHRDKNIHLSQTARNIFLGGTAVSFVLFCLP